MAEKELRIQKHLDVIKDMDVNAQVKYLQEAIKQDRDIMYSRSFIQWMRDNTNRVLREYTKGR